jgi:hypothetical protein
LTFAFCLVPCFPFPLSLFPFYCPSNLFLLLVYSSSINDQRQLCKA